MAGRKYKKNISKSTEPLKFLIDLAGAVAMGAYVKHKVKSDYKKGVGESSAKTAAIMLGRRSFRKGSDGLMSLGGLIGLSSALNDVENEYPSVRSRQTEVPSIDRVSVAKDEPDRRIRRNLWREHCEDGSSYGLSPYDYPTADDYEEALQEAKRKDECSVSDDAPEECFSHDEKQLKSHKYTWRNYCPDGSKYGLYPENFECADDYADALENAGRENDL